jgi:hypothetical protein
VKGLAEERMIFTKNGGVAATMWSSFQYKIRKTALIIGTMQAATAK